MSVQSNAIVIADTVQIGEFDTSNGMVTVSGANASLDAAGGAIRIGLEGTGTLTVENGASLTSSGGLILGHFAGGDGTLRVTGNGTTWATTQQVTVGSQGTGRVYLEDGATATHGGDLRVGYGTHQSGYVTISDAQTQWNATQNAYIGDAGNGDLQVRGGASFDVTQDLVVGNGPTGAGYLVVNGNGSQVTYGALRAGVDGYGYMWVEDGGALGSAGHDMLLGVGATGEAGLQATGNGTIVTAATLVVGDAGKATVVGSGGAVIESTEGYLGRETTGSGSLSVSGLGSAWYNTGELFVGYRGVGELTVQNGGVLGSIDTAIGAHASATGTMTVTGAGSTWYASGDLSVGDEGKGTLTLSDGGTVWAVLGNGPVKVATVAGSTGDINIGAAPGSPATGAGNLFASVIEFGAGAGSLNFNHTETNYLFIPQLTGAGTLNHFSGVTIMAGLSNTFSGPTNVTGGTLVVEGSLGTSTVTVSDQGVLAGTGNIATLVAEAGGAVAPGSNGIGTLNVAGNVLFNPDSFYRVEVDPADASDRIAAGGTATLDGGTVVVSALGGYNIGTPYVILNAQGGVSGVFTEVVSSQPTPFLDFELFYDPTTVFLDVARSNVTFGSVGMTPNQIATGGGADSLPLTHPVVDALVQLSIPEAQYAFDQLSGEIHASARTVMLEDSRFIRIAVNDRIRAAFEGVGASNGTVVTYENGGPRAVAATTDGVAVWGHAFGSWGRWNSDGNAARLERSIGGLFFGADTPVFDTWRFGAVAGYSHSSFDVDGRHSSGSSDNYHAGLYGGTAWGDLAFRTGAAYTWHDISTDRSVAFTGFSENLKADYDAGTAQVFGELGYGFSAGDIALEPFANLAYVNLHTDDFTEKGGAAALTSGSASTDATFTTLGLRAATSFDFGETAATLNGMAGWQHTFGDVTPDAAMRFASGSETFTIGGVPIARDAAVVEAGLDFALSPAATLGVSYGGLFGSDVTDQSVRANFDMMF